METPRSRDDNYGLEIDKVIVLIAIAEAEVIPEIRGGRSLPSRRDR